MSEDNFEAVTPEGRLINGSLYERDVYVNPKGKEGDPLYKVEMAFNWDDIGELQDFAAECAEAEWGAGVTYKDDDGNLCLDEDKVRSPILDGDDLSKRREEKGKVGDAYAGFAVIRATTKFNKHGEDASGGVYVADENAVELDFEQRTKVFNGSYGFAAVTASAYEMDDKKGVKFYLRGYQYTREGEPLRGNSVAGSFKPVAQASASRGRKARGK